MFARYLRFCRLASKKTCRCEVMLLQVPNTWCFFSLCMTLTMVRGTGQLQALTQALAHIFLFPNCHKSRLRHKKIETKLLQIETDPPQIDTELPQIETEMLQIKTFFFPNRHKSRQHRCNLRLTHSLFLDLQQLSICGSSVSLYSSPAYIYGRSVAI